GDTSFGFKDGANLTTEYTYDANGNMETDENKGITRIDYNHLNLPTRVYLASGDIIYIYDATGVKLRKVINETTITDYAGNYIYEDGTLKMLSHPEGYIEPGNKQFNYVYQFKDHLGNIRLTYADSDGNGTINSATEIIEEHNYYPFGLKHKGYNDVVSANVNSVARRFMFGGKEFNDELGLDWYDISARNYDPTIGRWMNLDPLAEDMRRHSPYNFGFDNPVYFQDPDGMMPCPTGDCPDPPSGNGMHQMNKGNSAIPIGDGSNPSSSHSRGSAGSSTVTGSDVVRSVSAEVAYTGIQTGKLRKEYIKATQGRPLTKEQRSQLKTKMQSKETAVTRAIRESKRPASNEKNMPKNNPNKTNAKFDKAAKVMGDIGKGAAVFGVVISANNIANADNKVEAVAKEGGAWSGAILGGETFGAAGASLGPWGAAAGVVVGSILGGFAGEQAVEKMINNPGNGTGPELKPVSTHGATRFGEW
ncbi:RHS repeat-associated core domain-containing protein, partial [uncultured Winogradskyella sp.]|uniref:RHS repeat domain-containing protein n=1 Tax=uncultured Winogradskyella sp. TaxID=395353 RepID=UPI002621433A